MKKNRAARHSGSHARAYNGSRRTRSIISDREQAYLVSGLLIAVSFGLMFIWAAVMF